MLCKNPYMQLGAAYPCGQCMPCRFNRRRLWTHRIMLESLTHAHCSFLTLTYAPEHLPDGGTLVPRDVQLFLKRLRKVIAPLTLRYFFVGEYGDQSQRPHYHAALFGLGVEHIQYVQSAWPYGHVHLGDLSFESSGYIAGYVTKKLTAKDDLRLNGRHPEFSRMSLRPGIGAVSLEHVANVLKSSPHALQAILNDGDVPAILQHGGRKLPLGRYLRRKLREHLKIYDEFGTLGSQPLEGKVVQQAEMQILREDFLVASQKTEDLTLKQYLINKNAQKVLNMETKAKIHSKKVTL